jgi:hypothetical protein
VNEREEVRKEFDVVIVQLCRLVAMNTGWNVRWRSMKRSHAAAVGRSLVDLSSGNELFGVTPESQHHVNEMHELHRMR